MDTTRGRALRVLIYQVIVGVLALILDPNVTKAILNNYPGLTFLFLGGAPILSGIYNYLRTDVPN